MRLLGNNLEVLGVKLQPATWELGARVAQLVREVALCMS